MSVLVLEKCMRETKLIYSQCTHTDTCIWDLVGEPDYEDGMHDEGEGI